MEGHTVTLAAEKITQIGPLPITNSILTTWIVTAILIGFAYLATRKVLLVPKGLQNIAEMMIEGINNLVTSTTHEHVKTFVPIIASFFFFILLGNYFGILPGVGTIGFWEEHAQTTTLATESATQNDEQLPTSHPQRVFVPFLRPINSDLNTTLALAIVSILATHFLAVKYLGIGGYIKKFISFNPIFLFVGIIELAGEFTKVISLSFRLFGNIYAGETVLVTAQTQLFAFLVPIPFIMLELIVGFVQALVFAMLTLVFMIILTTKQTH